MKTVYILRYKKNSTQCLANLLVMNEHRSLIYSSYLLERGWNDNKKNISCVIAGIYDLVLEYSPAFNRDLWEAKGIPNRSECKFHEASFWKDLNGCFSPGAVPYDINYDGHLDMIYSKNKLDEFHDAMGNDTKARLVIIDDD